MNIITDQFCHERVCQKKVHNALCNLVLLYSICGSALSSGVVLSLKFYDEYKSSDSDPPSVKPKQKLLQKKEFDCSNAIIQLSLLGNFAVQLWT